MTTAHAFPAAPLAAPTPVEAETLPARAMLLQAQVLAHRRLAPAATAFVTELAATFGCRRATLGFARQGVIGLIAVSGGGTERLVGESYDAIADAMDEVRQQAASIHLPADGAERSLVTLAHARLLQRQGGAIATVPLVHWGRVVGALSCEWAAPRADLPALTRELETLLNLVGPVLDLMRVREKSLARRLLDGLRRSARALRDTEDRRLQFGAAAAAVAVAALLAVPMEHRVGGTARIEGEAQRTVVAPADGFLKLAHARPGDRVRRGEPLVELADEELRLQQQRWQSELAQQENAYATALAGADRSAMVIALARAEQARAQLALVEADLARTQILAPFDGIVLQGDLNGSVGAPVERGKPLMVMAPGEAHRVIVEVDERDVAAVQPGQHGRLALSALPWDTIGLEVVRVTPIAQPVEGRNVFEVEARLDTAGAHRVRPGLEGVAKIAVDERPLAWIWLHRAVDWLRLSLWTWWA